MMKEKILVCFDAGELRVLPPSAPPPLPGADTTIPEPEKLSPPPDSLLLIRYGKIPFTRDGIRGEFEFSEKDADRIISDFQTRGRDLVIDFEHQSLSGSKAPAAGWIGTLEKCTEGLLARIKCWTEEAAEYIRNKEYRYFSPTLYFTEDGEHISSLHSVALTNHPALHNALPLTAKDSTNTLPAESSSAHPEESSSSGSPLMHASVPEDGSRKRNPENNPENNPESDTGSQLPENRSSASSGEEEQQQQEESNCAERLIRHLRHLLSLCTEGEEEKDPSSSVTEKAEEAERIQTILDTVCSLIETRNKLDAFLRAHHFSDLEAASDEIARMLPEEAKLALESELAERRAEELVTEAFADGKIPLSGRPWAKRFALRDPEAFRDWARSAPAAVPDNSGIEEAAPGTAAAPPLTQTHFTGQELEIFRLLGIDRNKLNPRKGAE